MMLPTDTGESLIVRVRPYLGAVLFVLGAMVAALLFRRLPHANLSLLFLLAVVGVAAVWGLWPSIFAGVLGFFVLNFFFTAPILTLTVEEEGDVATLAFFLAMAALTGNLAARMRAEMASNRAALDRVSTLFEFSRRMTAVANADQALASLVNELSEMHGVRVVAFLANDDESLRLVASRQCAADDDMTRPESVSDIWRRIGRKPIVADGRTHIPLLKSGRRVGLIVIDTGTLVAERKELTEALCEQASIAVERALLVDDLKEAQLISETEQLRSGLLSSVSHDLRTPLASIIGSTTSLLEYRDRLRADDRSELLHTVLNESQRLNRYIQNLLDMTRLGQEGFRPKREWVDLNDLISAAIERLNGALQRVQVKVEISPSVSLIFVHGALIEQALVNLIDNAADYSPDDGIIEIKAMPNGDATILEVIDQGEGIAESEREKVFDMFYRARQGDRDHQGAGLGLTICRSLVAAHSGTIRAYNIDGCHGTRMRITLPLDENPVSREHA